MPPSRTWSGSLLYVRQFPGVLKEMMAQEIARSRREGGRLRSQRDVLVAALVERYRKEFERRDREIAAALNGARRR